MIENTDTVEEDAVDSGLSDEMVTYIVSMPEGAEKDALIKGMYADYEGQEEILDKKFQIAAEMIGQQAPQGRQYGRQYFAANPMEHIGSGMEKVAGMYNQNRAMREKKALSGQREMSQQKLMAAMLANNQGNPSQQAVQAQAQRPQPTGMTMQEEQVDPVEDARKLRELEMQRQALRSSRGASGL